MFGAHRHPPNSGVNSARGITLRLRDGREKVQTAPEQKIRCVIAREKVNGCSDGEKTSFRNMA